MSIKDLDALEAREEVARAKARTVHFMLGRLDVEVCAAGHPFACLEYHIDGFTYREQDLND